MAAALLDHEAAGRVHVTSAGSEPADQLNPSIAHVLDRGVTPLVVPPGRGCGARSPARPLDADHCAGEVRAFAAGRADPFDDEQRAACRYLDRAVTVMLVPSRRAEANWLPSVRRNQDAVNQQVGPVKAGMPPGDVIGMHHSGSSDYALQPRRQGGLATRAAPIDSQDDRPVTGSSVFAELYEGRSDHGQQLHTPRPSFRLITGKL
jgi:hypothetical protein